MNGMLLRETQSLLLAGGFVWNAKGEPMAYNVRDTLLVNRFVDGSG